MNLAYIGEHYGFGAAELLAMDWPEVEFWCGSIKALVQARK